MAINKIKAIYLRDGEKKAKIYLSELLRTHPSPLLKAFKEDWDEWVRMNNEELKLMNIKILRQKWYVGKQTQYSIIVLKIKVRIIYIYRLYIL